jgi:hypothetical protein
VGEVEAAVSGTAADREQQMVVGFSGFDIWTMVGLILQVLIDQIGNCQARPAVFNSMRQPGLFARIQKRRQTVAVFKASGTRFEDSGMVVFEAIAQETELLKDEEMAVMFQEAQNPPIDLMLI